MGIFGLNQKESNAQVIYLPVPWDVTTSYGKGTANGPEAILEASPQIDFFDFDVPEAQQPGLFMRETSQEVKSWNQKARVAAEKVITAEGVCDTDTLKFALAEVNSASSQLNQWVFNASKELLDAQKILGVVGGDHSVPFGAIRAFAETVEEFSILHFDAHMDLRKSYQGFEHSHASIMRNVIENIPNLKHLTQVGIRDFCQEEWNFANSNADRISIFYDSLLAQKKSVNQSWSSICDEVISTLGKKVWISFDIDGLDPALCPNTGTPVPGGLSFQEMNLLLRTLVESGREIMGFDLVEVSPGKNEWDANVGARVLYKLTGWLLASKKMIPFRHH